MLLVESRSESSESDMGKSSWWQQKKTNKTDLHRVPLSCGKSSTYCGMPFFALGGIARASGPSNNHVHDV